MSSELAGWRVRVSSCLGEPSVVRNFSGGMTGFEISSLGFVLAWSGLGFGTANLCSSWELE